MAPQYSVTDSLDPEVRRRLIEAAAPILGEFASIGTRIGSYRLESEIGRGAFGVVFKAVDERLERTVALKVLSLPARLQEHAEIRLQREAFTAARLDHPHIATIYEALPQAIAMRLIDGRPLNTEGVTDFKLLAGQIADAARAVQHAHDREVIHRDLKPGNLLVEDGHLFVTDFGLAKAAFTDLDEFAALSQTGDVLGTPAYMAPEQARGDAMAGSKLVDIYGLGATLYHAACGCPPFSGPHAADVLRQVLHGEAPRPRQQRGSIPKGLEAIICKAMHPIPQHRYISAGALADDLDRFRFGHAVLATSPSRIASLTRRMRRHPRLIAAVAASILALTLVGILAWNERNRRIASDEALQLSSLIAAVRSDVNSHWRLGEMDEARARLEDGIHECREFLGRRETASAWTLLGSLLQTQGRDAEAREALERALAIDDSHAEARLYRGLLLSHQAAWGAVSAGTESGEANDTGALIDVAREDLNLALASSARRRMSLHDRTMAEACQHWLDGRHAAALTSLRELTRRNPAHPGSRLLLSRLEGELGNGRSGWTQAMIALDVYRGFGAAYASKLATAPRWVWRLDSVTGTFVDLEARPKMLEGDARAWALRSQVRIRQAIAFEDQGRKAEAITAWSGSADDAEAVLSILHAGEAFEFVSHNCALAQAQVARLAHELDQSALAKARWRNASECLARVTATHAELLSLRAVNRAALLRMGWEYGWQRDAAALDSAADSLRAAPSWLAAESHLERARILRVLWAVPDPTVNMDEVTESFSDAIRAAPVRPEPWVERGAWCLESSAGKGRAEALKDLSKARSLGASPRLMRRIQGIENGAKIIR